MATAPCAKIEGLGGSYFENRHLNPNKKNSTVVGHLYCYKETPEAG